MMNMIGLATLSARLVVFLASPVDECAPPLERVFNGGSAPCACGCGDGDAPWLPRRERPKPVAATAAEIPGGGDGDSALDRRRPAPPGTADGAPPGPGPASPGRKKLSSRTDAPNLRYLVIIHIQTHQGAYHVC